jgi:hypothetical protein
MEATCEKLKNFDAPGLGCLMNSLLVIQRVKAG